MSNLFSCADRDLIVGDVKTLQNQRKAFTLMILILLSKYFQSPIEVPQRFEMDICCYRTRGEMELERKLMGVTEEQLIARRIADDGEVEGSDHAYVANLQHVRSEFRYLRRTNSYWSE